MKKQKNSRIIDKIESIDPRRFHPNQLDRAIELLKCGRVVAFPTQGLYGLGVDAFNASSIDRVFTIKKRSYGKPLLALVPDRAAVSEVAAEIPSEALRLMDQFWPGQVTIVLKSLSRLPENLVAGTGKIGVRVSGHPVARALVSMFGQPMTGTSANFSGSQGCHRIEDIDRQLLEQLDLVLDAGPLAGGRGSTVVDVTGRSPIIIREGMVPGREILAALN